MNQAEYPGVLVDPLGRVDRVNAAKMLNLKTKTLSNWAVAGRGPRPFHAGGKCFYWANEVAAFGCGQPVPIAA